MTELYMLQDKSTEYLDTWKFLERRIEEGHQIQEVLTVGDQTTKKALNSAFLTVSLKFLYFCLVLCNLLFLLFQARNILGLHFNR